MKKQTKVKTKSSSEVREIAGMTAFMLGASAMIALILTLFSLR
jgi:hypothetical protein